jgi:FkbM family methyltransferase
VKILDRVSWRIGAAHGAREPLPLLLDSLRLLRSPYLARSVDGTQLRLLGGRGEWFTFYENLVRQDYFRGVQPLIEGDIVIDVGANIGAFSVVAARRVGSSGHVHAYEPDPRTCERLRENVELNGLRNVTVYNSAVGAKSGKAQFFRYKKGALSSLFNGVDGRQDGHASSFEVDVVAFPEVIRQAGARVTLLKVDCEGAEYEMLSALDQASALPIRSISMEVHKIPGASPEELTRRLRWLGFNVKDGYPLTAVREGNG